MSSLLNQLYIYSPVHLLTFALQVQHCCDSLRVQALVEQATRCLEKKFWQENSHPSPARSFSSLLSFY
jgi:hypothetical protein